MHTAQIYVRSSLRQGYSAMLLTMLIHAHAGGNVTTLQNSDNNITARFMNEIDIIIIFQTYY